MAATLAGGEGAVLSHRSAAAHWGIGQDGPIPSITVPGTKRPGLGQVATGCVAT
jgi:hypothetical protein